MLFLSFAPSAFLRGVMQFVMGFKLKLSSVTCKVYFGSDKNGECHAEPRLEVLLCGVQKFQTNVSTLCHTVQPRVHCCENLISQT
jgi:hypothetical protein